VLFQAVLPQMDCVAVKLEQDLAPMDEGNSEK
jgi:hypothetical protein